MTELRVEGELTEAQAEAMLAGLLDAAAPDMAKLGIDRARFIETFRRASPQARRELIAGMKSRAEQAEERQTVADAALEGRIQRFGESEPERDPEAAPALAFYDQYAAAAGRHGFATCSRREFAETFLKASPQQRREMLGEQGVATPRPRELEHLKKLQVRQFSEALAAQGPCQLREDWARETFTKFSEEMRAVGMTREAFVTSCMQASDERFAQVVSDWEALPAPARKR